MNDCMHSCLLHKKSLVADVPPTSPCTHQCVPLHVLSSGELLATDLTGVGPLTGVGSHVPLQDALVHGRETAVGALELFTDHREVIHCKQQEWGW